MLAKPMRLINSVIIAAAISPIGTPMKTILAASAEGTKSLLDGGGKDLLHFQVGAAAERWGELLAAVGPDGMGNASKRNQPFVIAVLVS